MSVNGAELSYQWIKDNSNLANMDNKISGATEAMLTISAIDNDDNGVYSVTITNPATPTAGIMSQTVFLVTGTYTL